MVNFLKRINAVILAWLEHCISLLQCITGLLQQNVMKINLLFGMHLGLKCSLRRQLNRFWKRLLWIVSGFKNRMAHLASQTLWRFLKWFHWVSSLSVHDYTCRRVKYTYLRVRTGRSQKHARTCTLTSCRGKAWWSPAGCCSVEEEM